MDVGWLSSQIVIGVVVVGLVVGGLAFFALVEPRRGAPAEGAGETDGARGGTDSRPDEADAADGQQAGSHGAGEPATGEQPTSVRPASGRPTADPMAGSPAAVSVFETEPCWQSLMKGRADPAGAAAGDTVAVRVDVDAALVAPDGAGEAATPATTPGLDAAAPG